MTLNGMAPETAKNFRHRWPSWPSSWTIPTSYQNLKIRFIIATYCYWIFIHIHTIATLKHIQTCCFGWGGQSVTPSTNLFTYRSSWKYGALVSCQLAAPVLYIPMRCRAVTGCHCILHKVALRANVAPRHRELEGLKGWSLVFEMPQNTNGKGQPQCLNRKDTIIIYHHSHQCCSKGQIDQLG